jgi:archaemetzincin
MKKLLFIVPVALIVLTSYYYLKPVTKINIQPLGAVSPVYINQIKKSIISFYGYDCVVKPKKEITKDMLSRVTKRIDAKKALRSNLSFDNLLIITEKDICYNKNKSNPEWGIFGLGSQPGRTCIVSTFKLKRLKFTI